jgi:hypothetical protein
MNNVGSCINNGPKMWRNAPGRPAFARLCLCSSTPTTGGSKDLCCSSSQRQKRRIAAGKIAELIPEVVKDHWWQHLLHGYRARRLRAGLLRYGGSRIVVINIPWYLEEPHIEEGLEQEEIQDNTGRRRASG